MHIASDNKSRIINIRWFVSFGWAEILRRSTGCVCNSNAPTLELGSFLSQSILNMNVLDDMDVINLDFVPHSLGKSAPFPLRAGAFQTRGKT